MYAVYICSISPPLQFPLPHSPLPFTQRPPLLYHSHYVLLSFTIHTTSSYYLHIVLNVMFATMDILVQKYNCYKVETIGDAYVSCANVVDIRPDHTRCLIDFALAISKSTKTMFTADNQPIIIRVGIHTGAVIAGVVGRKMPRYHLFGETGQYRDRTCCLYIYPLSHPIFSLMLLLPYISLAHIILYIVFALMLHSDNSRGDGAERCARPCMYQWIQL